MIGAIFATDEESGFGKDGQLPWPFIKQDLAHFKSVTSGGTIVMGRKTYESLPVKLPNRKHIVITSNPIDNADVTTYASFEELLAEEGRNFWIIGGAGLIAEFSERYQFDVIFHSTIYGTYDSDVKADLESILRPMLLNGTKYFDQFEIKAYINVMPGLFGMLES